MGSDPPAAVLLYERFQCLVPAQRQVASLIGTHGVNSVLEALARAVVVGQEEQTLAVGDSSIRWHRSRVIRLNERIDFVLEYVRHATGVSLPTLCLGRRVWSSDDECPSWPAWIPAMDTDRPPSEPEQKPLPTVKAKPKQELKPKGPPPAGPVLTVQERYPSDSLEDRVMRLSLLERFSPARTAAIAGTDIGTVSRILRR